jgi:tetratricopeptide (TPR) repeat protein
LIKQWKTDKSYRRSELWLQKYPSSKPSKTVLSELNLMQEQFKTALNDKNTTFKANVEKTSTLTLLKSKMKLLFRYQKKTDLEYLKAGFINDNKQIDKAPYLLLIDGYIAELSDDFESAFNYYNSIINLEQSPVLEEALLRILSISLAQENAQNALLALDCLTQLSPLYLPFQAELARIVGNTMLAIDSYNAYIEFFPQDTLSQLKLAALYIDIKVYEAAEIMLEHILQASPELETAISLKNQLNNLKTTYQSV